jgi:hypothetical protein
MKENFKKIRILGKYLLIFALFSLFFTNLFSLPILVPDAEDINLPGSRKIFFNPVWNITGIFYQKNNKEVDYIYYDGLNWGTPQVIFSTSTTATNLYSSIFYDFA